MFVDNQLFIIPYLEACDTWVWLRFASRTLTAVAVAVADRSILHAKCGSASHDSGTHVT